MTGYFSIADFGAKQGELCTKEIQAAFDAASAAKGTVVVPAGEYITGTIFMGNASLWLQKGAVLKGSGDIADYPLIGYVHNEMGPMRTMMWTKDATGVTIYGEGELDMNGCAFHDFEHRNVPKPELFSPEQVLECTATHGDRPNQPILFMDCKHITLKDYFTRNAPCWSYCFLYCEDVRVTDLTIDNDRCTANNDGMHFCGCKRVSIRGCHIVAGDDCIALSGITNWDKPCEEITISDCTLECSSKSIAVGYMHSIVRDVVISNCTIMNSNRGIVFMSSTGTGLVENVLVSNVRFDARCYAGNWWGNGEPICLMSTHHHLSNYRDPEPVWRGYKTAIRNVRFRNIICSGENAIGIVGENGSIENISFDGLTMSLKDSKNLPLKGRMIDVAPSEQTAWLPDDGKPYWLFMRDAKNVTFRDVVVEPFHGVQPEMYIDGEAPIFR